MSRTTLTVIDKPTGRSVELAIEHGTLRAVDLRQIVLDHGEGLVLPASPRARPGWRPPPR